MSTMADAMLKAGIIDKKPEVKEKTVIYSGKQAVNAFRNATPENPMFAEIEVYSDDVDDHYKFKPEWRGRVACTGVAKVQIEDDYGFRPETQAKFRAIEDGTKLNDIRYGYHIKSSTGFPGTTENFVIKEMLESTPDLINQYKKCIDDIKVHVTYRDFGEELNKYGMAEIIPNTEVSVDIPGAHSLDEGMKWMLENHPGQIMGMSMSTSSGDFLASAVPCCEYPKGRYENRQARELYAKEEAERLGVTLGKFDYSLADKALKGKSLDRGHEFEINESNDLDKDSQISL